MAMLNFSADQVIGILAQRSGGEHTVFFADVQTASADELAENHTFLKTQTLVDPPSSLVHEYGQPGAFLQPLLQHDHSNGRPGPPALHVIVSVGSGQRHAEACYDNLVHPLLTHLSLTNLTVHKTTSADTIVDLARTVFEPEARAGTPQHILLLSGDGGIVDLLHGLLNSKPATSLPPAFARPLIALIPLGTGNALAHSAGLTHDRTLSLSHFFRGRRTPLPIFSVAFDPPATPHPGPTASGASQQTSAAAPVARTAGAVVFSWALHAALVADSDTPEYRVHGASRFQLAAKENLFPPSGAPSHAYRGAVAVRRARDADWARLPGQAHSYVLATLCTRLERSFTVSPASRPLDPRLRVVQIGVGEPGGARIGGERIMALMQMGYAGGGHVREEDVAYEAVDALRIEVEEDDDDGETVPAGGRERWRRVCVDGKIFAVPKGGNVVVEGVADGEAVTTPLDIVHIS